jgi:hypothetical protein
VLDNEAKLMLEADSLQASEEKYKLSYEMKSLKASLLVTVLLMMTTSGVYSQKQLTSSRQHNYYFCAERQYFVKIQRGKIDAEKVIVLKKSLSECSATKTLYVKVIQLKDMRADSLEVIILKQREIEKI